MRALQFFFGGIFILLWSGCSFWGMGSGSMSVVSWNLQNLFDDVDDGTEYSEYDPGRGNWGTAEFRLKLQGLREGLDAFCEAEELDNGPDVILVQEVENENALSMLAEIFGEYPYRVFAGTGIGVGILSRKPLERTEVHQVSGSGFRPLLEASVRVGTRTVYLINNHWKSQYGGRETTEALRIDSAVRLNQRVEEILAADPEACILLGGDFNEDLEAWWSSDYPCALSSLLEADLNPEALLYSVDSQNVGYSSSGWIFYSPWGGLSGGSYCYRGTWSRIDHFFLSGGLLAQLERGPDFSVGLVPPCLSENGIPAAFRGRFGCSDHLPLLLRLDFSG